MRPIFFLLRIFIPVFLETTMLGINLEDQYRDEKLREQAINLNFERALYEGDRKYYSIPDKNMMRIDMSSIRKLIKPIGK